MVGTRYLTKTNHTHTLNFEEKGSNMASFLTTTCFGHPNMLVVTVTSVVSSIQITKNGDSHKCVTIGVATVSPKH